MANLPPITVGRETSHAEQARSLVARTGIGTLCTLARNPAGYPFGSVAAYGLDDRGQPILLISQLAEHTRNIQEDPRGSLFVVDAAERGDVLACGRVTLMGDVVPVSEEQLEDVRERYLKSHPEASLYAGFKDFAFYRLEVRSVRYVGGFGKMSWMPTERYHEAGPDPLVEAAAGIIEHMNEDHQDSMLLMVQHQAEIECTGAEMIQVDRLGFTMKVVAPEGERRIRLGFLEPVEESGEVRKAMVKMVRAAREALSG